MRLSLVLSYGTEARMLKVVMVQAVHLTRAGLRTLIF